MRAPTPMPVPIKSAEDIAAMRVAGRLASELLDYLAPHVQPGITTGEIDRLAHDYMIDVQHTIPATLNYAPPGHTTQFNEDTEVVEFSPRGIYQETMEVAGRNAAAMMGA